MSVQTIVIFFQLLSILILSWFYLSEHIKCYFLQQYSKESIKKLVLGAESLIREEVVKKNPKSARNSFTEIIVTSPMGSIEKAVGNPKIKRVQVRLAIT